MRFCSIVRTMISNAKWWGWKERGGLCFPVTSSSSAIEWVITVFGTFSLSLKEWECEFVALIGALYYLHFSFRVLTSLLACDPLMYVSFISIIWRLDRLGLTTLKERYCYLNPKPLSLNFIILQAVVKWINQQLLVSRVSALIAVLTGIWYVGVLQEIKFSEDKLKVGPANVSIANTKAPTNNADRSSRRSFISWREGSRRLQESEVCGWISYRSRTARALRIHEGRSEGLWNDGNKGNENELLYPPFHESGAAFLTYPAFEKRTAYKLNSGAVEIHDAVKIETHFPQENTSSFNHMGE